MNRKKEFALFFAVRLTELAMVAVILTAAATVLNIYGAGQSMSVVSAAEAAAPASPVATTPASEPSHLNFYTGNNAFVARFLGDIGATIIVRNHKGKKTSAHFAPRTDERLHGWGYYNNQDAVVPNPGEITTHPYTVFIERDGARIGRFYMDPLKVTNTFGPSFYAHIHGAEDSYRAALHLNGVGDIGRKTN